MTRTLRIGIGTLIGVIGISTAFVALAAERNFDASDSSVIPGQYIVVFNEAAEAADITEERLASHLKERPHASYRSALKGFAATLTEEERKALENDKAVVFVAEDRLVTTADTREVRTGRIMDAARNSNVSAQAVAQTLPTGVNRINAENKQNTGTSVHVAVVDSGILVDHPDLKTAIAGGKSCVKGTSSYTDQNGHGTHVAGIIAAQNNSLGVVGVAPGAKLWSVRVLDRNGYGSYSSIICGLDYIVTKAPKNGGPIKVANISLGGSGVNDNNCGKTNNDPLHQAICRVRDAGVTIVAAAGNSGANANSFVPAAYNDAVISVSALVDTDGVLGGLGSSSSYGADDTFASFSNYGSSVDLGAPGVNINSTWLSKGYRIVSGTSMASPHVAGTAALYIATHPNALWNEVKQALIAVAEVAGSGHSDPGAQHPEPVVRADSL